ncbi:HD-GYP domain-containing protein [Lapillicoccus jejuensis]|uniref:HD-GYP domain-containing protein n=1 Tax=Lapillicoccus jejuensis TaxID=402171 RepID=UPI00147754A0|nr:HD domain-containing phosphohydrolase [Lapillicoccus jejuensis]
MVVCLWLTLVAASTPGPRPVTTSTERWVLVTFLLTIVLGEVNRIRLPGARESAPMSVAGTFGLAMTTMVGLEHVTFGPAICLLTTAVAMLLATGLRLRRHLAPHYTEVAIRFLSVAVVAVGFRWLPLVGGQPLERLDWEERRWLLAVAMVLVSGVAIVAESLLTAAVEAVDHRVPWHAAVSNGLGDIVGLGAALAASGTLIALAERAIGIVAIPVFLLPLALTQFALRRYAGIRETQGQTIRTLSRLTELGGYTRPDHPTRVAHLSVAMARMLGVSSREASSVEYAALLHDIGQLALRTPIPQGATMMAAPADQDRIARDGAEIVRTTGVLADVADILEVQAKPYRHVRELGENIPLAARIIKVANAYDDLAGEHPTSASKAAAVERIHLGLGYEYDPAVVEALERVLDLRRDGSGAVPVAEPTAR